MDGQIIRNYSRLAILIVLSLIPVSTGWILFHGAVTQDGPSHLAAAKIADEWVGLLNPGDQSEAVRSAYRLQFEPVPNWGGQALGMALIAVLPVSWAEIVMNLAGLWLPALSLSWLIGSYRHPLRYGRSQKEMPWTEAAFLAFWITTVTTNVLWTFGFSSFLIGMGMAWSYLTVLRTYCEKGGRLRLFVLTILWCTTFLCHLVAFAITGMVAACLLILSPEWTIARRASIAASMITACPLVFRYRVLTRNSRLEPIWEHLSGAELLSPANWTRQLGWVDPVSLHSKTWHPLTGDTGLIGIAFQPGLWVAISLGLVLAASIPGVIDKFRAGVGFVASMRCILALDGRLISRGGMLVDRRSQASMSYRSLHWRLPRCLAWNMAFVVLAILGTIGPDSLGPRQGHYLPQRFCLTALSIVPAILISTRTSIPFPAVGCIAIAWFMQTVSAIDFARRSHELTGPVRSDLSAIRKGDRILALIEATPWPYRANPRLHADALLVCAAPDIVSWNLYEAEHPYFPLQFRDDVAGLEPSTLEAFAISTGESDPARTEAAVRAILGAAKKKANVVYLLMSQASSRGETTRRTMESEPGWALIEQGQETSIYRQNLSPDAP